MYKCKRCGEKFEELVAVNYVIEHDDEYPVYGCPHCESVNYEEIDEEEEE